MSELDRTGFTFYRTCQSCGAKQKAKEPNLPLTNSYKNSRCRSCGSRDFDFGSWQNDDPNYDYTKD